jgi:hypothetical protein
VFKDNGVTNNPWDFHDSPRGRGEVQLFQNGNLAAHFELTKDLSKAYPEWTFVDVLALRVGSWMKDVIEMAAQLAANRQKGFDQFKAKWIREAARNIDLGYPFRGVSAGPFGRRPLAISKRRA